VTDLRVRRPPPSFRAVSVSRADQLTPRLMRVTVAGPALEGLIVDQPAASVRLLLPKAGTLVIPTWNGNEFLLDDGTRPAIRTLTPRRLVDHSLDLEVVIHGDAPLSSWARAATPGDAVAVSGTGRGYDVDPAASAFVLLGDETAIPAIGQLLEVLPHRASVEAHIEAPLPVDLPAHPRATVAWHDDVVEAALDLSVPPDAWFWAAGEAAAMQRIRHHLFDTLGVARAHAWVRGYWKRGRAGTGDAE
jgi:NADPH-dependent ferric siderophore reductase